MMFAWCFMCVWDWKEAGILFNLKVPKGRGRANSTNSVLSGAGDAGDLKVSLFLPR